MMTTYLNIKLEIKITGDREWETTIDLNTAESIFLYFYPVQDQFIFLIQVLLSVERDTCDLNQPAKLSSS